MDKKTNIRELLARYMEGESTQAELKLLKEYFDGEQDLPIDLIPYAQMFAVIEEETPTPSTEALDKFSEEQVLKTQRRLPLWPFIAAACIAAFAVILLAPPQQEEENMAIAYVEGKMLNDKQVAMQMGENALQEIFSNGNQEEQLSELFNEQ
ncbi:MAG: hypothetical protein IJL50_09465 [Bacteroidaceae bacterium]|nr:hypothetical protein [Bacteroidaceae bacterium]